MAEGTFYCDKCGTNTIVMREHEWEDEWSYFYGQTPHMNHDRWFYEKWKYCDGKWSLFELEEKWTYFAPLSEWADYDYWTCKNCKSQYAKDFTTFIKNYDQMFPVIGNSS